jgi:hypothetical protein
MFRQKISQLNKIFFYKKRKKKKEKGVTKGENCNLFWGLPRYVRGHVRAAI